MLNEMNSAPTLEPALDRLNPAPSKSTASGWLAWSLVFLGLWVCFVAGSVLLCGTGFIHPETHSFLPHYLSGRPFLELIFDNRTTEWGNYQARELAFVFDYLDCQFIAWCAEHGHAHLFSASHYLLLLVAGFALWRICARHLALDHPVALGFVALLWSTPTAIFYTSFYRSAKVAVLTASLCTIWAWFSAAGARRGSTTALFSWKYPLFAICAFCMPMVDKMGLAFLCMLGGFLATRWFRTRSRGDASLLLAGGAALGAAIVYGWKIGPALTMAMVHYPAETGYSSLPLGEIIGEPRRFGAVILGALLFTLDSFRIVLGNLPAGLALAAAFAIWRLLPRDGAATGFRGLLSPAWLFVIGCCAVFGLYAVMLLRFESMFSTEHRRVFYSYPVAGLWLVVAAAAVRYAVLALGARGMLWARIAVVLSVTGSLYAVQENRFVMRHGKYAPFYENAARCFTALRPAALAEAGLTRKQAATLLAEAPLPGDGAIVDVRQDRVYLALAARIAPRE